MRKTQKLIILLAIFAFTSAPIYTIKAQTQENMKTFFDYEILSTLKIQVNATAEVQPTENITVNLKIDGLIDVDLQYFNLSVYGFIQGEEKTLLANITGNNLKPYNNPIEQNFTFNVPEHVWGRTLGEVILTFKVTHGPFTLDAAKIPCRFDMTLVKNVYLENLESNFQSLNENYTKLNQTYWELHKNYTDLQGSLGELGNTRIAVGVLAVIAAIFVVSTLYLVLRKPKQYW